MADAQTSGNEAGGGGAIAATSSSSSNSLDWISPEMKSELDNLPEDVKNRAKAIYRQKVAEKCKGRPQINMKKARKAAKARKKALKANIIYDEDGNPTGEQGAGGCADELMRESIAQAKKPPPRARTKAVVGGRSRRTRRSRRRRRRTRRRRNKRKSKSRRRKTLRRRGRGALRPRRGGGAVAHPYRSNLCKTAYDDYRPYRCIRCDHGRGGSAPPQKGICIRRGTCSNGGGVSFFTS